MARLRYQQIEDGEWFRLSHSGYKHMCCDCHRVEDVTVDVCDDGSAQAEFVFNARSTALARRRFGFKPQVTPETDNNKQFRFRVGLNGHKHECPDCRLIHDLAGKVGERRQFQMRFNRNDRATMMVRARKAVD